MVTIALACFVVLILVVVVVLKMQDRPYHVKLNAEERKQLEAIKTADSEINRYRREIKKIEASPDWANNRLHTAIQRAVSNNRHELDWWTEHRQQLA